MARPRAFEYDDVLDKAAAAFWARGYQATSISDLADATGLKPGSIYKAFGDKQSLFLNCVERYMKTVSYKAMLLRDFETPLRDSLRKLFDAIIDSGEDGHRISGCLVTNTAFELSTVEPEIGEALQRHLAQTEKVLRYRVMWAQESGEISKTRDAAALTTYLLTVIQGLLVSSRVNGDKQGMREAGALALGLLD